MFLPKAMINGCRCLRPRRPRQGFSRFTKWQADKPALASFAPGDLAAWHNLKDVKLVTLQYWDENHLRIRSLDMDDHEVHFVTECRRRPIDEQGQFARYYAENVFEELTETGQWYLDRPAGRLYYLPREGESIETAEVFAPVLEELVRFAGTKEKPVRHIVLENLTFHHAEWDYPPERTTSGQASMAVPGTMRMLYSEECVILCGSQQVFLGNKEDGRAAIFEHNIVLWYQGFLETLH